jgi:hypothetical protein
MKHLHLTLRMIAIVSTTAILSTTASAQTYYKCKAPSGATVYTATPTPSQQCTTVQISGQYSSTSAARSPAPASTDKTKDVPSIKSVTTTTEAVAVKASPTECAEARKAQDMLNSGQKVFETDKNGQRSYIDEKTRTERTKQFQTMLNTRCNP